jgi:hypothetical protein
MWFFLISHFSAGGHRPTAKLKKSITGSSGDCLDRPSLSAVPSKVYRKWCGFLFRQIHRVRSSCSSVEATHVVAGRFIWIAHGQIVWRPMSSRTPPMNLKECQARKGMFERSCFVPGTLPRFRGEAQMMASCGTASLSKSGLIKPGQAPVV